MVGANSEGAESWRELQQQVSSPLAALATGGGGSPQHQSAVLDSSTSVLVCLADKVEIDGAANAAVFHALRVDPRVDDQTRAGLEVVGLAMLEGRIEGVQKSGDRDLLRGRRGRSLGVVRRRRVDRHARRVTNKAHLGQLRAGRPFREVYVVEPSGLGGAVVDHGEDVAGVSCERVCVSWPWMAGWRSAVAGLGLGRRRSLSLNATREVLNDSG
jgi:hypothetical protein